MTTAAALTFLAVGFGVAGLALLLPGPRSHPRGRREQGWVGSLAQIGSLLRAVRRARAPRDLDRRLDAAGRPGGMGVRELMAAKAVAVLLGLAAGILIGPAAPGRLGAALTVVAPAAGFMAPDMWLARRAAERARAVRRALPAQLDLLRVSVEAGLSLPAALGAVGERAGGTLGAEWAAVERQVALGVPLADALDRLARSLPLPEIAGLVASLGRAQRHGAAPARALAAQALDARLARRRRIHEEAARAAPKIQLVVALVLVPSVLLMLAAALIAHSDALLAGF